MSYASIGTSNYLYTKQDVTSARRFFRSVERVVIQHLNSGANLCKVVLPYYAAGDSPPDGKRLSAIIADHAPVVIAADNLVGTIPGLFIQGYSFPAQYVVERSRSFIGYLRDCSDPSCTELFVDINDELQHLSDCVQWARQNRYEIQPIDFRRQLNEYFEKVLKDLAAISKRFRVMESDMERPHKGLVHVSGYIAMPTKQLDRFERKLGLTYRVASEIEYFVSPDNERGTLRTEKQLGGDVRLEMQDVAVGLVKDTTLSHRQAAREVLADYDGRPGAFPNNKSGEDALRKRIDRECEDMGLR